MKKVLITGVSGTLGQALAQAYRSQGCHVIGVTRRDQENLNNCDEVLVSQQVSDEDAEFLFLRKPDLIILNAGQIETEVAEGGLPLSKQLASLNSVNYEFPAKVTLVAAKLPRTQKVDIVAIGSIADGSPSCFGPVYHASKMAMNYWISSVGPMIEAIRPNIRVKLYRPGVIAGPMSWAPVLRLNDRGYKIRAARCEGAPHADTVASRIIRFIDSKNRIGSDRSPISFHFLRLLYWAAPNIFFYLQSLSWKKVSKFHFQDEHKHEENVLTSLRTNS